MVIKDYGHKRNEPYPQEIREMVIAECYQGMSRKEAALKYRIEDPTIISYWMRKFGGEKYKPLISKNAMNRKKSDLTDYEKSLEAEIKRLKSEVSRQQKQVETEKRRANKAELKTKLLDAMIDMAEDRLNITIRKKCGPK
jgi:transposase-like protein